MDGRWITGRVLHSRSFVHRLSTGVHRLSTGNPQWFVPKLWTQAVHVLHSDIHRSWPAVHRSRASSTRASTPFPQQDFPTDLCPHPSTADPQAIHRVIHRVIHDHCGQRGNLSAPRTTYRGRTRHGTPLPTRRITMDASRAEEFEAFVRGRTPALLRAAYLLTGDQHLAEDLVNDALIRTHQAWHRLRDGSPEAYTRKIMYHLQISWWRRRRRSPERLTDAPPEPGAGVLTASTSRRGSSPGSPCRTRSAISAPASALCSCCATSRTCPSRRSPSSSA